MTMFIPSPEEVRALLAPKKHAEMQALAKASGVPFTTLWKVRNGESADPRLETVRAIWPHIQPGAEAAA